MVYVLCALGACQVAAQSVNYTFDKGAVFSSYKTYRWVNIENAQHLDDLTADQLMGTVEVALAKKGLTKSPSDAADLLIGYQIARGSEKQLSRFNIGGAYGSAAWHFWHGGGRDCYRSPSGQLVLDMYDSQRKQLVWRGVLSQASMQTPSRTRSRSTWTRPSKNFSKTIRHSKNPNRPLRPGPDPFGRSATAFHRRLLPVPANQSRCIRSIHRGSEWRESNAGERMQAINSESCSE